MRLPARSHTGRCSGTGPTSFPAAPSSRRSAAVRRSSAEHVFAYAALRPAERRDDGWWLTGRPDPDRDAEEAERLVASCDGITIDGLTFSLEHVWRGEAILRVAGGADERITDSDAFFRDRHPVLRPQALVPEAERTARAAEAWSREVMRRLEGERFNVITLKWWGRPRDVPTFEQRHGLRGTFIASSAFLRGLALDVGLAAREEPETADAAADLRGRVALARERLDAGDSFVFCHVKSADAAGHTKDPRQKQAMIETLDTALGELPIDRAIVCLTGDHATPASPDVIHSGDPVALRRRRPGSAPGPRE